MKNYFLLGVGLLALAFSPQESQAQRRKKAATPAIAPELVKGIQYREIGPFRGGRSAAVTGVPGQPNLFYMGATGGGVWKTDNAGTTWKNISDGFFGGSIGAVAVAPSDPNVIYVGGGEVTLRGNVSSGSGMYKSIDAGKTWNFIGLPESRHIPRVRIHPTNPDVVYAAVLGNIYKPTQERGVYKSTDGGKSWRGTLFANANAGAVDLVIDPNNARVLYATTWRVNRTPYSLNSGGEGSKVWKSTDAGESWTELSTNKGFAKGTLGIMGIVVSPVKADRVWAMVENKDQGGLYRSEDGGATWNKINDERKLRQRAWYYTRLYADSQDADGLYVLNVRYHKSTDGGKSFETANAPHGDHHDLWIAPEDNQRMIMADDGGAQVSTDGGASWSTYHNQPTAQYYRVTTDNSFPYRIYVAQQDNSTQRVKHRSDGGSISESDWEETAGGESAHIAVDPKINDIVYGGSYGGFLTRVNHKTGTTRGINVWPDNPMGYGAEGMKYRFQWNFPIIFSKHNPDKLYTFSQHVHATTNEGQSWEILSPDLTRNDPTKLVSSGGPITQDNTGVEYYATILAAAESPLKEGLLWVGSDDGLIHISQDGGSSWQNITPKNMPTWAMVNSVEPSAFDPAVCYIAATSYKSGDFTPYLYKTADYGKTWTTITKGIPNEHFTRVLREDPAVKGLLYAGTEKGMYVSYNDGASWEAFQNNLPIVPITDLAVKDNSLIVATQGRSLWMIDDLTVLHQLNAQTMKQDAVLFDPKDAYRTKGGGGRASLTAGTNLPAGVTTHMYFKDLKPSDKVSLTYTSKAGDTLAHFSTDAKERGKKLGIKTGANTHNWNTRGKGAERLPGMILWWANLGGPKADPGTYGVHLNYNGSVQSKEFEILADPRAEASISEMQDQYDFITEINTTVDLAHQSIKKIRAINEKLDAFVSAYSSDDSVKDLVEKAKELKGQFSEVEKALYQTQNRSGQDPLNFPIRLTNKLAHLNSLVSLDDFGPTVQDRAVKAELTTKIEEQLAKFDALIEKEIDAFNEAFNQKQLPFLQLKD